MILHQRTPDFSNLAAVLERKVPARPTMFEFFMNGRLYDKLLSDYPHAKEQNNYWRLTHAFAKAGYDYVTVRAGDFSFPLAPQKKEQTISLNDATVKDKADFDRYRKAFLSPKAFDLSLYEEMKEYLPFGMKVITYGPGGVLENVISLVGYENLCMLLYDDEQFVHDLFAFVGENLLAYYAMAIDRDFVGAVISNDDWGFNTQTMLSPEQMRKYVFPWHKKIVELIHAKGKYAILHSCGKYDAIIDDVVYFMKYDARHSYEDNITPIEQAYEDLQGKIAVLGGIDMTFLSTATPEEVYARAKKLLQQTASRGGFALGSGNSIPSYVPDENYFAMTRAALKIN